MRRKLRRTQMNKLYPCPCCGEKTLKELGEYEICKVCDWEDDPGQSEHPDDDLGANELSLNAFKAMWEEKRKTA
jgi:hypothetical protein